MNPMNPPLIRRLASVIALLTALGLGAVPARPTRHTAILADGTTVGYRTVGDERSRYMLTDDGRRLIADGHTLRIARDGDSPLTVSNMTFAPARRPNAPSRAPESMRTTCFPTSGSPRGLVILAQYSDVSFTVPDPQAYFSDMLNLEGFGLNNATGSAADYFKACSMGKFTPVFDVYGPVTLPGTQRHYGGNSPVADANAHLMIVDACDILASQGFDFSPYDCDNDGVIDNVYVFYAGYGESSGNIRDADCVWPHSWDMQSAGMPDIRYGGLLLSNYACSNELYAAAVPEGIGTFCHEFSHVIGLPDLYYTGTMPPYPVTPDTWSILDVGCYLNDSHTPPVYSSFERMSLGWLNPQVIDKGGEYSLAHLADTNTAYIVRTDSDNEFFLLENRRREGWDAHLEGEGMLVWHIDYDEAVWSDNTVNNSRTHQRVDLVEAVGRTSAYASASDPFPGLSGITDFTASTTPGFLSWSGSDPGHPLTDIRADGSLIRFTAGGSGGNSAIGGITANGPVSIGGGDAIVISGTDLPVSVFTLTGTPVYTGTSRRIDGLPTGLYIVRVAGKTAKVALR